MAATEIHSLKNVADVDAFFDNFGGSDISSTSYSDGDVVGKQDSGGTGATHVQFDGRKVSDGKSTDSTESRDVVKSQLTFDPRVLEAGGPPERKQEQVSQKEVEGPLRFQKDSSQFTYVSEGAKTGAFGLEKSEFIDDVDSVLSLSDVKNTNGSRFQNLGAGSHTSYVPRGRNNSLLSRRLDNAESLRSSRRKSTVFNQTWKSDSLADCSGRLSSNLLNSVRDYGEKAGPFPGSHSLKCHSLGSHSGEGHSPPRGRSSHGKTPSHTPPRMPPRMPPGLPPPYPRRNKVETKQQRECFFASKEQIGRSLNHNDGVAKFKPALGGRSFRMFRSSERHLATAMFGDYSSSIESTEGSVESQSPRLEENQNANVSIHKAVDVPARKPSAGTTKSLSFLTEDSSIRRLLRGSSSGSSEFVQDTMPPALNSSLNSLLSETAQLTRGWSDQAKDNRPLSDDRKASNGNATAISFAPRERNAQSKDTSVAIAFKPSATSLPSAASLSFAANQPTAASPPRRATRWARVQQTISGSSAAKRAAQRAVIGVNELSRNIPNRTWQKHTSLSKVPIAPPVSSNITNITKINDDKTVEWMDESSDDELPAETSLPRSNRSGTLGYRSYSRFKHGNNFSVSGALPRAFRLEGAEEEAAALAAEAPVRGQLHREKGKWKKKWALEYFVIQHGVLLTCTKEEPFLVKLCIPLRNVQSVESDTTGKKKERDRTVVVTYIGAARRGREQLSTLRFKAANAEDAAFWRNAIRQRRDAAPGLALRTAALRADAEKALQSLHDAMRSSGLYQLLSRLSAVFTERFHDRMRMVFFRWSRFAVNRTLEIQRQNFTDRIQLAKQAIDDAKKAGERGVEAAERYGALCDIATRLAITTASRMHGVFLRLRSTAAVRHTAAVASGTRRAMLGALVMSHQLAAGRNVALRSKQLGQTLQNLVQRRMRTVIITLQVYSRWIQPFEELQNTALSVLLKQRSAAGNDAVRRTISEWRRMVAEEIAEEAVLDRVLQIQRERRIAITLRSWVSACVIRNQRDIRAVNLLAILEKHLGKLGQARALSRLSRHAADQEAREALQVAANFRYANEEIMFAGKSIAKDRACYRLEGAIHGFIFARLSGSFFRLRSAAAEKGLVLHRVAMGSQILAHALRSRIQAALYDLLKFAFRCHYASSQRLMGVMRLSVSFRLIVRRISNNALRHWYTVCQKQTRERRENLLRLAASPRLPAAAAAHTTPMEQFCLLLDSFVLRVHYRQKSSFFGILRELQNQAAFLQGIVRFQYVERVVQHASKHRLVALAAAFEKLRASQQPTTSGHKGVSSSVRQIPTLGERRTGTGITRLQLSSSQSAPTAVSGQRSRIGSAPAGPALPTSPLKGESASIAPRNRKISWNVDGMSDPAYSARLETSESFATTPKELVGPINTNETDFHAALTEAETPQQRDQKQFQTDDAQKDGAQDAQKDSAQDERQRTEISVADLCGNFESPSEDKTSAATVEAQSRSPQSFKFHGETSHHKAKIPVPPTVLEIRLQELGIDVSNLQTGALAPIVPSLLFDPQNEAFSAFQLLTCQPMARGRNKYVSNLLLKIRPNVHSSLVNGRIESRTGALRGIPLRKLRGRARLRCRTWLRLVEQSKIMGGHPGASPMRLISSSSVFKSLEGSIGRYPSIDDDYLASTTAGWPSIGPTSQLLPGDRKRHSFMNDSTRFESASNSTYAGPDVSLINFTSDLSGSEMGGCPLLQPFLFTTGRRKTRGGGSSDADSHFQKKILSKLKNSVTILPKINGEPHLGLWTLTDSVPSSSLNARNYAKLMAPFSSQTAERHDLGSVPLTSSPHAAVMEVPVEIRYGAGEDRLFERFYRRTSQKSNVTAQSPPSADYDGVNRKNRILRPPSLAPRMAEESRELVERWLQASKNSNSEITSEPPRRQHLMVTKQAGTRQTVKQQAAHMPRAIRQMDTPKRADSFSSEDGDSASGSTGSLLLKGVNGTGPSYLDQLISPAQRFSGPSHQSPEGKVAIPRKTVIPHCEHAKTASRLPAVPLAKLKTQHRPAKKLSVSSSSDGVWSWYCPSSHTTGSPAIRAVHAPRSTQHKSAKPLWKAT